MSCLIDKTTLSSSMIDELVIPKLIIPLEGTNFIHMFKVDDSDIVQIPLAFCEEFLEPLGVSRLDKRKRRPRTRYALNPELREGQERLLDEIINHFNHHSTLYLKTAMGYGKTRIGICVSHALGFKTAILIASTTLIDSWMTEFANVSTARMYVVPIGKEKELPEDYDVYIIMTGRCKYLSQRSINTIGFLIVEEAKYLCTSTGIHQIIRFMPSKVLAICAEDKRADAFDIAIDSLFGTKRIVRESCKPLIVIKMNTPYMPKKFYQTKGIYKGRLDWTTMATEFYEGCTKRNDAIADIAGDLSDEHRIMILSSRVNQAIQIHEHLHASGYSSTLFVGSISEVPNTRIIVATIKKGSIGFDAANKIIGYDGIPIDMIIFASSFKKKYQGSGRADRAESPIIMEIVDNSPTIKKHYEETCNEVYKPRGAEFIIEHMN